MEMLPNPVEGNTPSDLRSTRISTRFALIASLGLACLSALAIALIVTQNLPVSSRAPGVLWPEGGVSRLFVAREGVVESALVKEGEVVKRRQPILVVRHRMVPKDEIEAIQDREAVLALRLADTQKTIESLDRVNATAQTVELIRLENQLSESLVETRDRLMTVRNESASVIYAPRPGRVVEMRAVVGAEVQPNQALSTVISEAPHYEARAYVSSEVAARLKPGGQAQIEMTDSSGQIQRSISTILSVSSLPVSPRDVDRSIVIGGPLYEVTLDFTEKPGTSKSTGLIGPGRPVMVVFEVEDRSVLNWMFNRFSGS